MKKLPIGISTFSKIIEDDYIYVDKTEHIYKMLNNGELYFFSRPRRFGKSLLLSTLEELFKGNKELFKGLYIYDKWDWDKKYPIISLDFGNIVHDTPEKLEISLEEFVDGIAEKYNINLKKSFLSSKFAELLEKIHEKTGSKVVILIDEYDKAINSHIDDIEIAKTNRDKLRSFYQVLKANDAHLNFVFITGVTKFSKASIFSELNNLDDITIHPEYVNICGYTQDEFETDFKEHIKRNIKATNMKEEDLLESIKQWYNGYSWDGKNFVYNPFTVLKFLDTGKFANYWFDTGTPKLLVDLIKEDYTDIEVLTKKESEFSGIFPNFELENLDFATVLLQTGYLTIKSEKTYPGEQSVYKLAIPNREVKESLFSYIIGFYTKYSAEKIEPMTKNMFRYITKLDTENLQKSFETLLHKIPNLLYGDLKKELEAHYQILVISWLQLLGFDIEAEVMNIKGRIDAVLKYNNLVVIAEFKFSREKSHDVMIEDALTQIIRKEYYKSYQNKNVILLGMAFNQRDVKCKLIKLEEALHKYQ
ncbi:putative AAA-ATPase [Methanobrevibacter cuticularis]|uniref:Putative AAA-ATPase n=1 Tax=Methanobrevibacter cuticularis TaxID=47311 RepID=A0A166CUV9_9EURY|nr:ATP-binding protein [Methanobrevibacter cuticularis]KZX16997.1 putative AAA-ATPase [Methanobrevibacter cuticularis]